MSQPPPITDAQYHAIDQISHLENYTKIAVVVFTLLLAASVVFTLLGLWKTTSMSIPFYTFVAIPIPLAAMKVIEMQKQMHADAIGKDLSWCLAVLRGYSSNKKEPLKPDPDEGAPPS